MGKAWHSPEHKAHRAAAGSHVDRELGWTMRPAAETLWDTGQSLSNHGLAHPPR